jgi:prepilin-type N-terminal cleavage/methylation domain-containing protein
MKPLLSRRCASFTLIELLAAIAILTIIMLALYNVSDQISKAWQLGERRTEVAQEARLVLELIGTELEGAQVSTGSPTGSGKLLTFWTDEDSTVLPGAPAAMQVAATPPNDQIFFIAPSPDTSNEECVDLSEFGYMVVFAREGCSNCETMKGGYYYLLRHQERSHISSGVNSSWDLLSSPDASTWGSGWPSTGAIGANNKVPILDNVLRFELRYEAPNSANPTNGTDVCETWKNTGAGSPKPQDYSITAPTNTLPRAVHIELALLDRRAAGRASAIMSTIAQTLPATTWATWTNGIPDTFLYELPHTYASCTNCPWTNNVVQPLRQVLRESLQTYYRSIYLRNAN